MFIDTQCNHVIRNVSYIDFSGNTIIEISNHPFHTFPVNIQNLAVKLHFGVYFISNYETQTCCRVEMSSSRNLEDFTTVHGIGKYASVQLRSDVQSEGK